MEITQTDQMIQKVRIRWLIVTILSMLVYPLFFEGPTIVSTLTEELINLIAFYAALSMIIIIHLIKFFILYHCAYSKPGTLLLSLIIFTAPIAIGAEVFKFFQLSESDLSSNGLFSMIGTLVVSCALEGWWAVEALRLRKVNKTLQFKKASLEGYNEAVMQIGGSSTLEELNSQVHQLYQKWPKFTAVINECYKSKKEQLLRTCPKS